MRLSEPSTLRLAILLFLAAQGAIGQADQPAHQELSGTAEIRGTLTVSPTEAQEKQKAHDPVREIYGRHGSSTEMLMAGMPATNEWKLSERAVLYLEGPAVDHQIYHAPERHPKLDQRDLQFHPRVLPILAGTTVDFPNRDNLFHNVFSYSRPKEFDLGRYPKDASRSVTFDEPGIVRVYCDIHSHMNATILVLRNPYFTAPADDGTFSLRHIPEGDYTLVLWYDRDVVERRLVVLRAGETLVLNFTL